MPTLSSVFCRGSVEVRQEYQFLSANCSFAKIPSSVRLRADLRIARQAQLLPNSLRTLPLNVRKRERNCEISRHLSKAAKGRVCNAEKFGFEPILPSVAGWTKVRDAPVAADASRWPEQPEVGECER